MRFTVAIVLLTGLFAGKTTWDGVYSEAQAKRGEAVFNEKCSGCHGKDLMGGDAPSLTGADFNTGWNDQTADDLAERIRTTMPADGPGTLTRPQTADVVAYIFSKDQFPAGAAELPAESPALKEIKILAAKP